MAVRRRTERGGFVGTGERGEIVRDCFGNGRQRSLFVSGAPGGEVIPVGAEGAQGVGRFGGEQEGAGLGFVRGQRSPGGGGVGGSARYLPRSPDCSGTNTFI